MGENHSNQPLGIMELKQPGLWIAFSSFEAVVLAYSFITQTSLIEWSESTISEISHKFSEPSSGTNVEIFDAKNQFILVYLNNSLSANR